MKEENIYTREEVHKLQKRPPLTQIQVAQAKIIEAINLANGNIAVSFSGGADSTFLLYLVCQQWSNIDEYKNQPLNVIFADTTNETNNIYKHIEYIIPFFENMFGINIILHTSKPKPKKNKSQTMVTICRDYGIPVISKDTSDKISKISKSLVKNKLTLIDVLLYYKGGMEAVKILKSMKLSDSAVYYLTGYRTQKNDFQPMGIIPRRWLPLIDYCMNVQWISNICCNKLKKEPLKAIEKQFGNQVVITGEMAEESKQRLNMYLKNGCNGGIYNGKGKSTPMGSMSEQGKLYGIKVFNIPISKDYGEIIELENGILKFSEAQRTGCAYCMFGIQFDTERFIRLQKYEPAKVKFAFKPIAEGGLGYLELCTFLNENCRCNIKIPEIT